MLVRRGRFGVFYACENYPTCTFTKQKLIKTDSNCPICGAAVVGRHGRNGSVFYTCEASPECDFSSWDLPLNEKCPECGDTLYYKKSRKSVVCKRKSCTYQEDREITVEE